MSQPIRNLIGGDWLGGSSAARREVLNPATGVSLAYFTESTTADVDSAVQAAANAFPVWKATGVTTRAALLFELRHLLHRHVDELARTIVQENGKTLSEARAELGRAVEYVEHACAAAELMKSSFSENVAGGIDTYAVREPLGVFAIVAPFNFPAMIPLYFAWAVAAGNTVVLKPSELCPLTTVRILELVQEAGFPPGAVNMVLGGPDAVRRLAMHPEIAGLSFVGSSAVAKEVYELATLNGKRAQCQGGAKNHLVVTASARLEQSLDNIVNSMYGNASQRCFAGSNVLVERPVYERFRSMLLDRLNVLQIGDGLNSEVAMGPVISEAALHRLHQVIEQAVLDGATLLLDGRQAAPNATDGGFFIGPTLFEASPGLSVFQDEVFGPIRCIWPVSGIDESIDTINRSAFGHTAVIYTEQGGVARRFAQQVETGQVGINVGTPAPIAFYAVGGRRTSFYGSLRGRANDAIDFYTDKKVIVSTWHEPVTA